jgi:large subunit ribosomal protein L10
MARPDKAAAVAELTEAFRDSSAAVLTEYRGLTVAELKELRRSLAGNATYAVVKNTLTKIAARDAGIEVFESLLEGPSAIAFVSGDPVEVAKGLRSFGREHPRLIVKGGILDGKPLTADEIRRLADLESREVLLAKFAGGMLAPAQQLVTVLAAPAAAFARALGALQAKLAADPDAATAGADDTAATQDAAASDEGASDAAASDEAASDEAAPNEPTEDTAADSPPAADDAAAAVPPAETEVEDLAATVADQVAPVDAAAPADAAPADATTDGSDAPSENPDQTATDGNAAASSDS